MAAILDGTTMSIIELVRDIWMSNACVKFEERSLNPSKVIENIIFPKTYVSREYNNIGYCWNNFLYMYIYRFIIISLNEVFGDIMVLASPPPRPLSNFIYGEIPPWGTLLLKFDTLRGLERSQTTLVSPKSSKCNISITNGPIAFKFHTEVKYLKLHKKNCQWLDYHPNCIRWQHLYPPDLQNAISP